MQVGLVEDYSPAIPLDQIYRGPDFVRLCVQATYRSPHTSLVHEGEYRCTVFFCLVTAWTLKQRGLRARGME